MMGFSQISIKLNQIFIPHISDRISFMIIKRLLYHTVFNRKYLPIRFFSMRKNKNNIPIEQKIINGQQHLQENENDKEREENVDDQNIKNDDQNIKVDVQNINIDDYQNRKVDDQNIQVDDQNIGESPEYLKNQDQAECQQYKQKYVVDKYLLKSKQIKQLYNKNELLEKLKQIGDNNEKLEQYLEQKQKQIKEPLKKYQQQLDFSPFFFVQHLTMNKYLQQQKDKQQLMIPKNNQQQMFEIENQQLKSSQQRQNSSSTQQSFKQILKYSLQKIKKLYSTDFYTKQISAQFLNEVLKQVLQHPQKNFLLNIFYQQITHLDRQKNKPTISDNNLSTILKSVSTQQYHEVNQLKFYWSIAQINPMFLSHHSGLIVKQLMKIKVNNRSISKQLKFFNYSFLNRQVSNSIVHKLVSRSSSLEEFIDVWMLTMVAISKLYWRIEKTQRSGVGFNLNDVLSVAVKLPKYQSFFMEELPQILHDSSQKEIVFVYKQALLHFSSNSNDDKQLMVSQFQLKYGLSLNRSSITEIEHSFDKDPQAIKLTFLNVGKPKLLNFQELQLVKDLYSNEYEKVLEYCEQRVGFLINSQQEILMHLKQAKQKQYKSVNSCALYVLKKIFEQTKYYMNIQKHRLTQQKLQNLKRVKSSMESTQIFNQFAQEIVGQEGAKLLQQQDEEKQEQHKKYEKQQLDHKQDELSFNVKQLKTKNFVTQDNKLKKIISKGLFFKKTKSEFSSNKDLSTEEKITEKQREANYQQYLKTMKQLQKVSQTTPQQSLPKQQPVLKQKPISKQTEEKMSKTNVFDFTACKSIEDIELQLKKNLDKINENNFQQIISSYKQIPIIGDIKPLLKYTFLYKLHGNEIPTGLKIDFNSTSGEIQKNYGEYLQGCIFPFVLPDSFYISLLNDQLIKMKRKNFKKTVSHLLLYKANIDNKIISTICDICVKQKSGFTLLQIINIINTRNVIISYQSLLKISYSLLQFNNMVFDLITFLNKYCVKIHVELNATIFMTYISKLVRLEQYEVLNKFVEIFRNELKPKEYKINEKLTPQENMKEEKIYRQKQQQRVNKQVFQLLKIISKNFKRNTQIPQFVQQLYQLYIKESVNPITSEQYGVGLLIFSQSQQKYTQLLNKIKQNPQYNTINVMQSAMQSLLLFGRNLKYVAQRILNTTLLQKKFNLTQEHLKNFGNIFLTLQIPSAYRTFLQYILRIQPHISQEIKHLYYKVLNKTQDDFWKGQINGLLDFIFNPKREKQRIQYKNVKQQQDKKIQILKNIESSKGESQLQNKSQDDKKLVKTGDKKRKKINQSPTYDEDGNFIYHSNLTKKMLRKNRVKFLTELFLNQFTPGAAQDTQDRFHIGRKSQKNRKGKIVKKKNL